MLMRLCAAVLVLLVVAPFAVADDGGEGVTVLSPLSSWRMHHRLAPPMVERDGKLEPHMLKVAWLDEPSTPAPEGWQQREFDDRTWLRTTAAGGCQTPYLSRQRIRGKFRVTDPAKVKGLKLSLGYHGGAIVYLNGRELARRHLPRGAIGPATVAESYPLEAFVDAEGELMGVRSTYTSKGRLGEPNDDQRRRMAARVRRIDDLAIPASALRRGVNVLAIELVRSPYHKAVIDRAGEKRKRRRFDWYTCELIDASLAAAGAEGIEPNVGRPAGLQVWNSDPMEAVGTLDIGDLCEPVAPIRLAAARNGRFSGKVVVGCDQPISGLEATAGELRGPGGAVIPASAVRIRYGMLWGSEDGFNRGQGTIRRPYPLWWPGYFGALTDEPPEPVAVADGAGGELRGAVMPVWATVRVPADARAGQYAGRLRIAAEGHEPIDVPVELEVADWTLPDSQDYHTWVELIEVPDTLSLEYEVPLWSDHHFELIARAFDEVSDIGTRIVYVPAIAQTNLGNAESMIRWTAKADGTYDWDFSVMERYLDAAEEHLGTPKVVVLQVWEVYMASRDSVGKRFGHELEERQEISGGAPLVTMLNPATGETENKPLPALSDPKSAEIWKAFVAEVRRRLAKRGIADTLMFGMFTDARPSKADFEFFQRIAPDVPWVHQGHGLYRGKVYDIAEVGYQASVWGGFRFGDGLRQTNQKGEPVVESLHGWAIESLDAVFERNTGLDDYPTSRWRFFAETAITGELRGVGRLGADVWPVIRDRRGRRRARANARFTAGAWSGDWIKLDLSSSTLAPGPDGPVATTRLVAMTEGVQDCEARIAIERALVDPQLKRRLGRDLAEQCEAALDRRLHGMWRTLSNYQLGGPFFFTAGAWRWTAGIPGHRWYLGTDWQADSLELYRLAGEVAKRTGGR